MVRSPFLSLLALLALLISSPGLQAAELVARQGSWATICTPSAKAEQHSCSVVTRLNGSTAPSWVRRFEYSPANKIFVVDASPAIARLRARIDDEQPFVFICSSGRCILENAGALQLLEEARRGDFLSLEPEGQKFANTQDVGLSGFEAMYRRATTEQR